MNRRCFPLVRLLLTCGCLFVLPLAVTLPCLAQTPTADSPQDATKQALSKMLQDYVSHFNARDFDSLTNLLSEKVTYNDESTQVSGATALVDGMRKLTTDEPSVKLSIEIQGIELEATMLQSLQASHRLPKTHLPQNAVALKSPLVSRQTSGTSFPSLNPR